MKQKVEGVNLKPAFRPVVYPCKRFVLTMIFYFQASLNINKWPKRC